MKSAAQNSENLKTGLVWYSNGPMLSNPRMLFQYYLKYRTKFSLVLRQPFDYRTSSQMVV